MLLLALSINVSCALERHQAAFNLVFSRWKPAWWSFLTFRIDQLTARGEINEMKF
jgi:hypothetical protein